MFHLKTIAFKKYIAQRTIEPEIFFDIYCNLDHKSKIKIWAFKMLQAKYLCII